MDSRRASGDFGSDPGQKISRGANTPPEVSGAVILTRMLRNAGIENIPKDAISEIVQNIIVTTSLQSRSNRMTGPWREAFITLLAAETKVIAAIVNADDLAASGGSRTHEILVRHRIVSR